MPNDLGERIKKYRTERGLTQAQLAKRLYLTPQAISKWENGLSVPDAEMLKKLAQVLQVTPDMLLGVSPRGAPAAPAAPQTVPPLVPQEEAKPVFSRWILYISLIFGFSVFFLTLIFWGTLNGWRLICFLLSCPIALIAFLVCKERTDGPLGDLALRIQILYFIVHIILYWWDAAWISYVLLACEFLFLFSILVGFRFCLGYGASPFRSAAFWVSLLAVMGYLAFAVWNVCTAAELIRESDIAFRIAIDNLLYMVMLTVFACAFETRTVLRRRLS